MTVDWSMVTFRAMGSHCRIVAPDVDIARAGEQMVHDLEQRWSRFLPHSEINALNASAGNLAIVSAETFELVSLAERARRLTGGVFNPLLLDHLEAAGYDRTWGRFGDSPAPPATAPSVSAEPIELIAEVRGVRLPAGTRFDPGGIGKGCAGDLVSARLRELGAERSQIELGGDVRLTGRHWSGGDWPVQVDDSDHGVGDVATIHVPEGGVATSSSIRRRWTRDGVEMHHLIDPLTGRPAHTDLAAATVVAPTLWWAETLSKVVIIMGRSAGEALLERLDMSAVLVGRASGNASRYSVVRRAGSAA